MMHTRGPVNDIAPLIVTFFILAVNASAIVAAYRAFRWRRRTGELVIKLGWLVFSFLLGVLWILDWIGVITAQPGWLGIAGVGVWLAAIVASLLLDILDARRHGNDT